MNANIKRSIANLRNFSIVHMSQNCANAASGDIAASVLLIKCVTRLITSASSAASPSIASPSSVINAFPINRANCVCQPLRISRTCPCTSRLTGSITAKPDDVSRMRRRNLCRQWLLRLNRGFLTNQKTSGLRGHRR